MSMAVWLSKIISDLDIVNLVLYASNHRGSKKEVVPTITGSSVRDEHSPQKHLPLVPPSEFTENPSNYLTARSHGSKVSADLRN